MQVRCVHCHEPMELSEDSNLSALTCASCGSNFSLVSEKTITHQGSAAKTIGRFELIAQVGAGGFGAVWMARDPELDRTVAVKVPRKGTLDPGETEQFLREARAAAQIRHPNIVGVHEVGRDGDTVYIVSDFVRGASLAEWLTGQPLSVREAAGLVATIAEALHHAHEAGIIHRDLKPGNVMMDLDSRPHLMDFGLARRTAGEVTMTIDGRVIGTPAYMSPEQARGEAHYADRRSDIYSLGVILFQLLTGELPFRGSVQMLVVQIQREDPPSPRKLNARIPRDLETICLKCLEKSPDRRYQTAADLAADVRRFLGNEPVLARPVGRVERTWRWCKRNVAVAASLVAVFCILLLGTGVSSFFAVRANQSGRAAEKAARQFADERDRANVERDRAEASAKEARRERDRADENQKTAVAAAKRAEENAQIANQQKTRADEQAKVATANAAAARKSEQEARWSAYVPDMNLAFQAYEKRYIGRANELLEKQIPPAGQPDLRGPEWYLLWAMCHGDDATLYGHKGRVNAVVYSPDGQTIASADDDGNLILWDAQQHTIRHTFRPHDGPVKSVVFSPNAPVFATGGIDGRVKVWDSHTWQLKYSLCVLPCKDIKLRFSPNGRFLAAAQNDTPYGAGGGLRIWDTGRWREWMSPAPKDNALLSLAFTPDGEALATSDDPANVRRWDMRDGRELSNVSDWTHAILVDRDGGTLIYSSAGVNTLQRKLRSFHYSQGKIEETPAKQFWVPACLAASPDGRYLASGGGSFPDMGDYQAGLQIWDWPQRREGPELIGHENNVCSVDFSPNGGSLVSGAADGSVRTWAVPAPLFPHTTHRGAVLAAAVSMDGTLIATGSLDKTVKLWDTATGKLVRSLDHGGRVMGLAFSPSGATLATASPDETDSLRLWSIPDGAPPIIPVTTSRICSVDFSPDGRFLAAGSYGQNTGTVQILDVQSGRVVSNLHPYQDTIYAVRFSHDGKRLAAGGVDDTVCLIDVAAQTVQRRFSGLTSSRSPGFRSGVRAICLSHDDSVIAAASMTGTIAAWGVESGILKAKASAETIDYPSCFGITFTSDDRALVATILSNRTSSLLHLDAASSFREIERRKLPGLALYGIAATESGGIVTGLGDGRALVWSVGPFKEQRQLGERSDCWSAAFSPDGRTLAVGGYRNVRLLDVATRREKNRFSGYEYEVRDVSFSPDGKWLAAVDTNLSGRRPQRPLRVWNTQTGSEVTSASRGAYSLVLFTPDSRQLITASESHQGGLDSRDLDIWDVDAWPVLGTLNSKPRNYTLQSFPRAIGAMRLFPDGKLLAIAGDLYFGNYPADIVLWDLKQAREIAVLKGHRSSVKALAVTSDGKRLLSVGDDQALRIWNVATGTLERTLRLPVWARCMTLLPGQTCVALGCSDGTIRLWELKTFQEVGTFQAHVSSVEDLATSPDQTLMVSVSGGQDDVLGNVRFWPLATPSDVENRLAAARAAGWQRVSGSPSARSEDAPRQASLDKAHSEQKVDRSTYMLGCRLLRANDPTLDASDRERRDLVRSACDGKLTWSEFAEKLKNVEPQEARDKRVTEQRIADVRAERAKLVQQLLTEAQANDSPAKGREALATLEHLLRLEPAHKEGRILWTKIQAYYPRQKHTNGLGQALIEIRPARFLMGSALAETSRKADEAIHPVRLTKTVYMSDREVSRGQFARFVSESGYVTESERRARDADSAGKKAEKSSPPPLDWKNPGFLQEDDHPVTLVSWNDADAFCQWLSKKEGHTYRLPTEAEWEYACRAGTITAYPWGDTPADGCSFANVADEAGKQSPESFFPGSDQAVHTAPAGRYRPNAWGLRDMVGNVREWCLDRQGEYPSLSAENPTGSANGLRRSVRGGSWRSGPTVCRSAARDALLPDESAADLGFRIVLEGSGFRVEPATPDSPISDPDRRAAEWVFSLPRNKSEQSFGVWVVTSGSLPLRIDDPKSLPSQPFQLQAIYLYGVSEIPHLRPLEPLTGLTEIRALPARDDMLASLSAMISLRKLWFAPSSSITIAGFARLRELTNINDLWLSGSNISDQVIETINAMPQLRVLSLTGRITDEGVHRMAFSASLRNLVDLNLGGTQITDAACDHLSQAMTLETLLLYSTAITNAGVLKLTKLSNLKHLQLTKTKVTADGVRKLQAALPNCKIEWDGPPPATAVPNIK